jgi:hypothetical protein
MSKGYTENEALAKAYKAIEYKVMVKLCIVLHRHLLYILLFYFAFLSSFDQKEKKSILLMQCINKYKTPLSK